jgi:WD40 repeat protein/predicted Ser/Thr protein kinase
MDDRSGNRPIHAPGDIITGEERQPSTLPSGDKAAADGRLPDDVRAAASQPRNLLGDYVLVESVGAGGAGTVYRAWQTSLRRYVALKLLHERDQEADRVLREAQIAARLSHPHIIPVYEVGSHDGRRYLTMKLIAGVPTSRVRLDPPRAAALMADVADALDHAHRAGVVHRDLKPHNLLLEESGHVWVTDFGIARQQEAGSTLTQAGTVVGTPSYMPPEQARGQRCDERSDVYALGATLYQLLTGQPPFDGETAIAVLIKVVWNEPTTVRKLAPNAHPELAAIVTKAMEKNPEARYASARALRDDLRRHLAGEPIVARPAGPLLRATKWINRHRLVSAGGLLLALAAISYVISLNRARTDAELKLAESLVAQADALGFAARWEEARLRYVQAADVFARTRVQSIAPLLGRFDVHRHAPPPLWSLRAHEAGVTAITFAQSGRRAITGGGDGTIAVWDIASGTRLHTLGRHSGGVTSLVMSPNGSQGISTGEDGVLKLWDFDNGAEVRSFAALPAAMASAKISADGQRALTGGADGQMTLWNLTSGRPITSFGAHNGWLDSRGSVVDGGRGRLVAVAFLPDGRGVLSGALNGEIKIYEIGSQRLMANFRADGRTLLGLDVAGDGTAVLTGGGTLALSNLQSGRPVRTFPGHLGEINAVVLSTNGQEALSAGSDWTVKLWDVVSGRELRSFVGHAQPVLRAVLSPDNRFVLSASADGIIKLWDAVGGNQAQFHDGREDALATVTLSGDGRISASGHPDGGFSIWDTATGRALRRFRSGQEIHRLRLAPDGRKIVSTTLSGFATIWDVETGRVARSVPGSTAVSFSADGQLLLTAAGSTIWLWDLVTGGQRFSLRNHPGLVTAASLSPDGRLLASVDNVGWLSLTDVGTGSELYRVLDSRAQTAVAFSPNGDLLVSSAGDTLTLRNARTTAQKTVLRAHAGELTAVGFSRDGSLLYSLAWDRTLRAWDVRAQRQLHVFEWTGRLVDDLTAATDGRLAVPLDAGGPPIVWDVTEPTQLDGYETRLQSARSALAVRPDDPTALSILGNWYAFRGVADWATDLLERARSGGAAVSPLTLGRCYWIRGDIAAARRELGRALSAGEAPAQYLGLVLAALDGPVNIHTIPTLAEDDTDAVTTSGKIERLVVSDPANRWAWSLRTNLHSGALAYGDRRYIFDAVPRSLEGAAWIRPANSSKTSTSAPLVEFRLTDEADVHLAIDDRMRPSWIDDTWSDTGADILITQDSTLMRKSSLFRKHFSAGPVTLGPYGAPSVNMYVVIVR